MERRAVLGAIQAHLLVLALAACIAATSATAAEPIPIRVLVGRHPDFGRLVFDIPRRLHWDQEIAGDRIVLHFATPVRLRVPRKLPRNVVSLTEDGNAEATVQLAPGAGLSARRWHEQLIIDAHDPAPSAAAPALAPVPSPKGPGDAAGASALAAPPAPGGEGSGEKPAVAVVDTAVPKTQVAPPAVPKPPAAPPAAPPPATPMPAAAPSPPPAAPASLALAVQRVPPPPGQSGGAAILLPFGAGVGAAALLRGNELLVVFDTPKPLDLGALRGDPVFSSAEIEVLPAATLLHLPVQPGVGAALKRVAGGWRLDLARNLEPPRPMPGARAGGALLFSAPQPGGVATIRDPLGGGVLLVGTQRQAGQAAAAARQAPEFALLPALQGLAVEPLSDRLQLDRVKDGFRLSGAGGALALAPEGVPDDLLARAAGLSRRFDLPALPEKVLRDRLDMQTVAAALAPPLARGQPRLAVARTMLALGLDQEALGTLRTAAAADPHLADDPGLIGLEGIAGVLADRPAAARGLLDPRLTGTNEVALWRALRAVMAAPTAIPSPEMASTLAETAPLLLTYPAALQARLLAPALEAMAEGGQAKAAAPFLAARPHDPRLALARGMVAEADGRVAEALKDYDALAHGRDRLARLRGAMRAVDLRLAQKQITPAAGAEALERLDPAWRGGPYELARRERLSELRLAAGAWRPALALLRDTATRFPDAAPALRARMAEAVARLLREDAAKAMPPLDFVSLLEENADVLGAAAKGPELQARLADRLLALDLPDAAAPLLERLMKAAPPDAGRAATGARLAALRLAAGDATGALAALSESQADDLPEALTQRRAILSAQATARTGDVAQAAAALASLGTAEADRVRADILENAGDLPGAVAALTALADRVVPAQGKLDPKARRIVLRLAADAARAGNHTAIAALRTRVAGRLDGGADADTIRLLLAEPVRQVADLARAAREAKLAGTVAAGLAAPPSPLPAR